MYKLLPRLSVFDSLEALVAFQTPSDLSKNGSGLDEDLEDPPYSLYDRSLLHLSFP